MACSKCNSKTHIASNSQYHRQSKKAKSAKKPKKVKKEVFVVNTAQGFVLIYATDEQDAAKMMKGRGFRNVSFPGQVNQAGRVGFPRGKKVVVSLRTI